MRFYLSDSILWKIALLLVVVFFLLNPLALVALAILLLGAAVLGLAAFCLYSLFDWGTETQEDGTLL